MRPLRLLSVMFVLAVAAYGQSEIREIDFENFTCEPFCSEQTSETIAVKVVNSQ